jgi:hypothetical protein
MADSPTLRGWKWDGPNSYMEVWVNGTAVARFDDATNDLRLLTNGLTIDAGGLTITAGGLTVSAGTTTFATGLTASDDITMANGKSIKGGSATGGNYLFDVTCSTGDDTIMTIQGATGTVGKWGLFGKAAVQQSTIAASTGGSTTVDKIIAVLDAFGLTATA